MVSVWGMTDKGIVRRENQDSCAYDIIEEGKLAWGVVCDGMGGAKAGDVASKMAVEAFCTQMDQLGDLEGPPPAEALLRTATEDANRVVYLKAQTDADCVGMGTTLVGLILQEATLWVVNVGRYGSAPPENMVSSSAIFRRFVERMEEMLYQCPDSEIFLHQKSCQST